MESYAAENRSYVSDKQTGSRKTPWESYCRFVDQNLILFEFTDEALSRLLLFSPLSSLKDRRSRWREVIWGLLQLHRLTIDIALRQQRSLPSERNPYGTSVAVHNATVPASAIRIFLTAMQSIGPLLQELVTATSTDNIVVGRRQAKTKAVTERARFLLRAYLLSHYWSDYWRELRLWIRSRGQQTNAVSQGPGLLMEGGLFPGHSLAPSIPQEQTRIQHEKYVGRRSGRRLRASPPCSGLSRPLDLRARHLNHGLLAPMDCDTPPLDAHWCIDTARVLLGELLYIVRPLFQAEAEMRNVAAAALVKSWVAGLSMDLSSLLSLRLAAERGNAATRMEWKRRRLRLLLYFLRVPVWERITQPTVDNVCKQLERVPVLGRLCANYIWEWLAYWRLYRVEEG